MNKINVYPSHPIPSHLFQIFLHTVKRGSSNECEKRNNPKLLRGKWKEEGFFLKQNFWRNIAFHERPNRIQMFWNDSNAHFMENSLYLIHQCFQKCFFFAKNTILTYVSRFRWNLVPHFSSEIWFNLTVN